MTESVGPECDMSHARARTEASRCLFCFDAPCQADCPSGIDVPRFIRRIMQGDMEGAVDLIRLENPLPWTCGVVCPTERLCASRCPRQLVDFAIEIGALQAYVSIQSSNVGILHRPRVSLDKRVAVVGSGPAGLAAASYLSQRGIKVCLFEAEELPGGLITYGVHPVRLDKKRAIREIKGILEGPGVSVKLGTRVSDPHQLLGDYAAVFVATGLGAERLDGILSKFTNVYSATELLKELNTKYLEGEDFTLDLGSEVLVIGGGNTVLDAALAARLFGGSRVAVVYRRTHNEMPAGKSELMAAVERGIDFRFLLEPVSFLGEGSKASGVVFRRTKLAEPGADGRREVIADGGANVTLRASAVIVATGRQRQKRSAWLKTKDVDPSNGRLGKTRIFVGGELIRGAGMIVEAIADGKQAARGIMTLLGEET